MHQYKSEQWLPISVDEAWDFFSSPKNLALITPPEMDFRILSVLDQEVYEGMLIDYKVKPIFGISMHWRTEICKVKHKVYFTDRQLIGPYKVWEHTHSFVPKNGGVQMQDLVNYQLPLGVIGKLVNYLLVKRKIKSIFDYREEALKKYFNTND